ncbi:MAG TPA: DHHA1 domain-containing protein [Burkholderiales bacterium]|nr:DHHA1 domain-containing protein [Burkholderiales bacterium]
MPPTERLYYTDCYLREFDALVTRCEPDPRGLRVYLDRTAFYPESGGQPSDRGTLAGVSLLDVVDEGDAIAHVIVGASRAHPAGESHSEIIEGATVQGVIDWARRFDHMQQHTGQHVLSAAFEHTGSYRTVSFHLGAAVSTIDLDSDRLGRNQIEAAEDLANQIVFQDREVRISFRSSAEANELELRKPTSREGDVRLIEVEGFDLSACGGTHVRRTGAIGLIVARKVERQAQKGAGGQTRVEFVCGRRALMAARRDFQTLGEASRLLSNSPDQVPTLIAAQLDELRALTRARDRLTERVAAYRARELCQAATPRDGWAIIRRAFAAEEAAEAKKIAHAVAKEPAAIALVGVRGDPTSLYFAQSAGGKLDMGALLNESVAKFGGKGGGPCDFAQGGGVDEARLEELLAFAERSASEKIADSRLI